MTEFTIKDEDLVGLEDKVIVLTGCSSGIGLATTELLLDLGAHVVAGDLNAAPIDHANFAFVKTNVTQWPDLISLFKEAVTKHGHIDHVYANAGIEGRVDFLGQKFDDQGDFLEPNHLVFEINFKAVVNTAYLGLQYLRKNPQGGSIVLIGSASSFQPFRIADYCAAKHGVLGLMRGLVPICAGADLPIRVNCIAPSWTNSGLVPGAILEKAGAKVQGPEVVARKVALLMVDANRNGQFIYSEVGKYKEIEEIFKRAATEIVGKVGDDQLVNRAMAMAKEFGLKENAQK